MGTRTPAGAPGPTTAATLDDNHAVFRRLLRQARDDLARGCVATAAFHAEVAALFATWRHTGYFASPELEHLLRTAGGRLAGREPTRDVPPSRSPRRVLHVATWSRPYGGLSPLVRRWVGQDDDRRHSVVLTRQGYSEVPAGLRQAVTATGGRIGRLDLCPGGYAGQVRRLRALAADADLVVVHVETDDVLPALAFHDHHGPPVAFVNHADHAFWAGAAACDAVVNLRESGAALSAARRGVDRTRSLVLPTPLEPVRRDLPRDEAKRRLGIPPEAVLLLSVARPPKFAAKGDLHFVDLHRPVLEGDGRVFLCVVGPTPGPVWEHAGGRFGERLRVVGETPDTALFLQAADVYVDSYPFISITSMLEAGLWGLPLVTFSPYGSQSAIFASDAPGLDGVLVRAHDLHGYADALATLTGDRSLRDRRGESTRTRIASLHIGDGWRARLADVYDRVGSLGKVRRDRPFDASRCCGEPDVHVPDVFGADLDLGRQRAGRLGVLPARARLAEWRKLRRDRSVGLAAMAPEAVRAARIVLRHRLRRRGARPSAP